MKESSQTTHLFPRSYVQSKGRARAKPSRYLLMVSTNERRSKEAKLEEFRAVEELALKECHQSQDEEDKVGQLNPSLSVYFSLR